MPNRVQPLLGRLQYLGWFNPPWLLLTDAGEVDLHPLVLTFFNTLDGHRASHTQTPHSYQLIADSASEFRLRYTGGAGVALEKVAGFGLSSVFHYLNSALTWLCGRYLQVEIEEGYRLVLRAIDTAHVFGVYFLAESNSCEVPAGVERTVCGVGTPDCCLFLAMDTRGFSCEKFSELAGPLLDRRARGLTKARRLGSCAVLGRRRS